MQGHTNNNGGIKQGDQQVTDLKFLMPSSLIAIHEERESQMLNRSFWRSGINFHGNGNPIIVIFLSQIFEEGALIEEDDLLGRKIDRRNCW